jgi:hypothetical protein
VKIYFYASFRQVVGTKFIDPDLPDQATVQGLPAALNSTHPPIKLIFPSPLLVDRAACSRLWGYLPGTGCQNSTPHAPEPGTFWLYRSAYAMELAVSKYGDPAVTTSTQV